MNNIKLRKQIIDYKIGSRNLFLNLKYEGFNDENNFLDKTAQMITLGIEVIEFDGSDLCDRDFLHLAKSLSQLCAQYGVTYIVKNRADIAYLSSADGVNLEQDGLDIASVREIIGGEMIVGRYINSREAFDLVKDGADYISVKQILSTPTEPVLSTGLEYAKWVSEKDLPSVFVTENPHTAILLANNNIKRIAIDNSIFSSSPDTVTVNLLNMLKK